MTTGIRKAEFPSGGSETEQAENSGRAWFPTALLLLLQTTSLHSATWYIAPNGSDSNAGASNSPFATLMRAQSAASANDIVYLRGGTYFLYNSNLTTTNSSGPRAIVNEITKNGIS